jgi:hypothetical protein
VGARGHRPAQSARHVRRRWRRAAGNHGVRQIHPRQNSGATLIRFLKADSRHLAGALAAGTFWIYAAICLGGFLYILRSLPETKQKSLEKIEKELADA